MILGMEKDSIWTMGQVNQSPDLEDGLMLNASRFQYINEKHS